MQPEKMNPQEGEERSARIRRLREEIARVIEREYALFGKYHEFAASFEALIPDEQQRHEAALQALSTTLKLGRPEVVEAFNRQHEELALLEKAVAGLFADRGAKTAAGKLGREERRAEGAASEQKTSHQVCPKCGERITFDSKENKWQCYSCAYEEASGERASVKHDIPGDSTALPATEWQKKCPMCGGQMHFHVHDDRWLCYTCAHEELQTAPVRDRSEEKDVPASTPGPAKAPSFAVSLADMVANESRKPVKGAPLSPGQPTGRKKVCTVCHKNMDWHELEKQWRCFYCGHKTRY